MNTPPVGVGFTSSPSAPDYIELNSQDKLQETTNSKIQQGATWNRGVILTKDSLDVPLEMAFGITNDRSEPSRPTLMPLFRTRFVTDRETEEVSQNYYELLRSRLPVALKTQLAQDESQPFEDRDPDFVALDNSLKFEAGVLTLSAKFGLPVSGDHIELIAAQTYLKLPAQVKQELLAYGKMASDYLDRYLALHGPNDPNYDLLLKASRDLKEGLWTLQESNESQGEETSEEEASKDDDANTNETL